MADSLTAVVRDSSFDPVVSLDDFDSIEWRQAWLDVGGWTVTVATGSDAAEALLTAGAGVTIRDETGAVELGGPVVPSLGGLGQASTRSIQVVDGAQRDVVTVAGTDDMVWLRDRVCDPAASAYDTRTGTASTVLLGYVGANTGGPRAIAGLGATVDPVIGSAIDMSVRWEELLTVCREAALLGGIGFRLGQVGRALELDIAAPVDRSADVRFGVDIGNLAAADIVASPAAGTHVYMAGQGEGVLRTITEVSAGAGRRIERFIDRRDLSTVGQLSAAGGVWLDENGGSLTIDADPTNAGDAVFGVDYRLGDLVGVDIDGVVSVQRVTAVESAWTADGLSRRVVLGGESLTGAAGLLRAQRLMSGRVAQLERR